MDTKIVRCTNCSELTKKGYAPVIGIYEDATEVHGEFISKETLEQLSKKGMFKGKYKEAFTVTSIGKNGLESIILVGLGKQESFTLEKARIAAAAAMSEIEKSKLDKVQFSVFYSSEIDYSELAKATMEGALLAQYKFTKHMSKEKEEALKELLFVYCGKEYEDSMKESEKEAKALVDGVYIARDLVNEPANIVTPDELALRAAEYGKEYGFEVEIFEEDKIKELKMEAFYSVAKGASNKPRLIVMRYNGNENSDERLGLVGKGLTYDSGGYAIKPAAGMAGMKSDMGGSAAVIGAMCTIASQKIEKNVVAIVAACENMISGDAYRNGDIIGSMKGKTIEVMNTDAEGRLTLVDAVYYAVTEEKVSKVVDIATLTGAAARALGPVRSAVVTNNDEFYNELENASEECGEKVWQFPCDDEYKEMIKSPIADLKNTGGAAGGVTTAGLFIGEFVEGKPWLHIDIAGTSFGERAHGYTPKGATGVGARMLYHLVKNSK